MRKLFIKVALMLLVLMIAGCASSTFVITKGGEHGYYFGRVSKSLQRILCQSGDFKKILRDAQIPEHTKPEFYRYVCTKDADRDKVVSLYHFLSPEEKKSLKRAFIKHGYTVNYVPC